MFRCVRDKLLSKRTLRGTCRTHLVCVRSGQSNMQWPMDATEHAAEEVPAANHRTMRLFQIDTVVASRALDDVAHKWMPCTSETELLSCCISLRRRAASQTKHSSRSHQHLVGCVCTIASEAVTCTSREIVRSSCKQTACELCVTAGLNR